MPGFKELGEPVPGRVIFELEVASSSLKLLEPHKEAFAAWQREHSEEAGSSELPAQVSKTE